LRLIKTVRAVTTPALALPLSNKTLPAFKTRPTVPARYSIIKPASTIQPAVFKR
jgi:hypothetical protein